MILIRWKYKIASTKMALSKRCRKNANKKSANVKPKEKPMAGIRGERWGECSLTFFFYNFFIKSYLFLIQSNILICVRHKTNLLLKIANIIENNCC